MTGGDPDGTTGEKRGRLREAAVDAALAVLVLAGVLATGVTVDAAPDPPAALVGAAATVAFEAVAGRRADAIRRGWRSTWVKAATLALSAGAVGAGAVLAPDPTLSAATGALVAYLLVVSLVASGAVPPPGDWV